jgi:hypothetical protein
MHLVWTYFREPLQELVNRGALVEVIEEGKNRETRAREAPNAT